MLLLRTTQHASRAGPCSALREERGLIDGRGADGACVLALEPLRATRGGGAGGEVSLQAGVRPLLSFLLR